MRCASCGYKNDIGATVCQLCSHKLGEAPRTGFMLGSGPDPNAQNTGGNTTTRRFGSNVERHYVVPSVGDHIKLEPAFTYLIGRDESCRIRIGSPTVSRKHAQIQFEGTPPKAVVKDLGSQNGTRVNGQPVAKEGTRELIDRDEIEVGGNKFLYCRLKPGESEKLLHGDVGETTVVGAGESSEPDEESADLVGNVAIMPLSEVLRRLETLKATGVLMVDAEGQQGVLQLQQGKPVGGMFGGAAGAAAAGAIARITSGKFRFEAAESQEAPVPESAKPTQRMAPMPQPQGIPAAVRRPPAPTVAMPAAPDPSRPAPPPPRPAAPPPPPRPAAPPPPMQPKPTAAPPPPRPAAPPPPRPQAPPKPPPPKPPGAP